jgi:hypothetical protein
MEHTKYAYSRLVLIEYTEYGYCRLSFDRVRLESLESVQPFARFKVTEVYRTPLSVNFA